MNVIINYNNKLFHFNIKKYISTYSLKEIIKNKIKELKDYDFYLIDNTKILNNSDPIKSNNINLKIKINGGNFKNPKNSVIAISGFTILYSLIGNLFYTFYLGQFIPEDPIRKVREIMKEKEEFLKAYNKNTHPISQQLNKTNSDNKSTLKKTKKIFSNIKNQPWGKMLTNYAIDRKWDPHCVYENAMNIEFSPFLINDSSFLSKITYATFMTFMLLAVFCSFFVITSRTTCGRPSGANIFISLLFIFIPILIYKFVPLLSNKLQVNFNKLLKRFGKNEINLNKYTIFIGNIFLLLFLVLLYIINGKILSWITIIIIIFNFGICTLLKMSSIQIYLKKAAIWLSNAVKPGFPEPITMDNADCSVLYRYMFSIILILAGFIFNFGLWFILIYRSLEKSCGFKIF